MQRLRKLLLGSNFSGYDLDQPGTVDIRAQILSKNAYLKEIYKEWYSLIIDHFPPGNKKNLEIGSGPCFSDPGFPDIIRSDVQLVNRLNLACDSQYLPFQNQSLKAVLMINVLHHIRNPRIFFEDAERCLQAGGIIAMIEPWKNRWSELIYKNFHHETFNPDNQNWANEPGGPLSSANGALPWIIFSRDRDILESDFPHLSVEMIKPLMPASYLLSGGMSTKQLMPGFVYKYIRRSERKLDSKYGMFAFILLRKTDGYHH